MDKNTLIGFGLLMVLLMGYLFYNQYEEKKYLATKKADSIANAIAHPELQKQVSPVTITNMDTSRNIINANIPHQDYVLANEDITLTFTNQGAYPYKAQLKKFKTHDGKPLFLFNGIENSFDFSRKSNNGTMLHSIETKFDAAATKEQITFTSVDSQQRITYTLPPQGYLVQMEVVSTQLDKTQNINLNWKSQSKQLEKEITDEKNNTQYCYNAEKEGYDYFTIREKKEQKIGTNLNWLTYKQHYFNTTLICDEKNAVNTTIITQPSTVDSINKPISDYQSNIAFTPKENIKFRWYMGPNNYTELKKLNIGLEEIIPLGYGIFSFVKYINKWLIMPIFNGLSSIMSSYGLVILLLTFIIRILMSPFTYKSYVSSAKMKALKPEIDALKAKYPDDQQTFGVEQMKLFRSAGVNPLGGCLPALLQLPVFFSLYSFFPNAIQLRQSKFLWATDLSSYDSILNLPFTIPFYGNHVSLFTILFVITSLLLALYSMNMTPDQNNPMMKYIPLIMPIMFLCMFNKLPAALTFYYFVSNLITLGLQYVIQHYIIKPEKIRAQIDAKKMEQPKESKFMKKMQELQQQNQQRAKKINDIKGKK